MRAILTSASSFLQQCAASDATFYNEAEFQHELGYWLRQEPSFRVFFERPAHAFVQSPVRLRKKEIDLVVHDEADGSYVPIELKCPRNGRIPETMFDACGDLQFLEELAQAGMSPGIFIMHVVEPSYWAGPASAGVYSHFRSSTPICGTVFKPTGQGKGAATAQVTGLYTVAWTSGGAKARYWMQCVGQG